MVKSIKNVSKLRFILQQPSPYWKDFGIDEISVKLLNHVTRILMFFFLLN